MSFLNNFLDNLDARTNEVTLRDARHAHQLFTEHGHALAPKSKFLYHVVFQTRDEVGNQYDSNTVKFQKEIGVLAKSVELPQYRASIENKQQYNRKKNVQTRIDYQDVTIKFHDDNTGVTRSMLQEYYKYYYNDGRHQLNQGAYDPRDKYKERVPRYGLDTTNNGPFFNYIKIFQLARKKWFSYTLVNPLISQWGHDVLEYSDTGGQMENTLVLTYESVIYNHGDIKTDTPPGFTSDETRYDTVKSPLRYPEQEDESLFSAILGPILNESSSSTVRNLLPGRANNSASNKQPSLLVDLGRGLIGALPGLAVPSKDTQQAVNVSALSASGNNVSNPDALISSLNSSPSAKESFTAQALNASTVEGTNYADYVATSDSGRAAIDANLQGKITGGDKKTSSFAQSAINSDGE